MKKQNRCFTLPQQFCILNDDLGQGDQILLEAYRFRIRIKDKTVAKIHRKIIRVLLSIWNWLTIKKAQSIHSVQWESQGTHLSCLFRTPNLFNVSDHPGFLVLSDRTENTRYVFLCHAEQDKLLNRWGMPIRYAFSLMQFKAEMLEKIWCVEKHSYAVKVIGPK